MGEDLASTINHTPEIRFQLVAVLQIDRCNAKAGTAGRQLLRGVYTTNASRAIDCVKVGSWLQLLFTVSTRSLRRSLRLSRSHQPQYILSAPTPDLSRIDCIAPHTPSRSRVPAIASVVPPDPNPTLHPNHEGDTPHAQPISASPHSPHHPYQLSASPHTPSRSSPPHLPTRPAAAHSNQGIAPQPHRRLPHRRLPTPAAASVASAAASLVAAAAVDAAPAVATSIAAAPVAAAPVAGCLRA